MSKLAARELVVAEVESALLGLLRGERFGLSSERSGVLAAELRATLQSSDAAFVALIAPMGQ